MGRYFAGRFFTCALLLAAVACAKADDGGSAPIIHPESGDGESGVQWISLFQQSAFFLSVEHGFRIATDPDIRRNLGGKFVAGYVNAAGNLHGWADGDPFFVNYIGHPMQGAVAGDIWIHNDPRYRSAVFGRNRQYWTGRLRATAFAWAYSEQFEIGPLSEASIGHVQARFPQQGFVDHVITPALGMGWMIAEDALDRYVIERIERKTSNRWVRILARGFLNPSRTFANCMEFEQPWHRERSPELNSQWLAHPEPPRETRLSHRRGESQTAPVPAFEFTTHFTQMVLGAGKENIPCSGGGASGVFNINSVIGIEADVSGCKMVGLTTNVSGDAITFLAGPRFSYRGAGRWTPWFHGLAGGEKVTEETLFPQLKAAVMAAAAPGTSSALLHDRYTEQYEATGLAAALGGGVDLVLNKTVAFRLGSIDYMHTWMNEGRVHASDLQVSIGFVLRMGD